MLFSSEYECTTPWRSCWYIAFSVIVYLIMLITARTAQACPPAAQRQSPEPSDLNFVFSVILYQ